MRKTLALALVLGLAACGGEKPKLPPAADAAVPTPITAEPTKPNPDTELAQRVARAIQGTKLRGIDVVAADGVVTLRGSTTSAKDRDRAVQAAAKVEGVKAVESMLDVVTGS